jgi:hypothetical protein
LAAESARFGINVLTPAKAIRDQDMKSKSTWPLRLLRSVKAEVARLAKEDGISINQFVATAVAEKLAAMSTAAFFAERSERADMKAFDRLIRRQGGEPPQPDDTIAWAG